MKNLMNSIVATALLGGIALAGSEAIEALTSRISGILPRGWTVASATNTVPYNLGIQPGKPKGTALTLVGPVTVKGPRGINPEKESFVIWIMPSDYVPVVPETVAQFKEAMLLGTNDTMAVYWTTFTTGTPSWETWQDDVVRNLGITRAQQRTALPRATQPGHSESSP